MDLRHGGTVSAVVLLILVMFFAAPVTRVSHAADQRVQVVIIGGSAAAGWHDETGEGYVVRALKAYARYVRAGIAIQNQAVPGSSVVNPAIAAGWPLWMAGTRSGIAVIAWGFLNDLRLGTRPAAIVREIRWEIGVALRTRHVVFVVSPPATTPSFAFYAIEQQALWGAVARMAASLHNPDVHVLDVMDPMKAYIVAHHQNPARYMAGAWDPDTAGHELAARILLQRMEEDFGSFLPSFRPTGGRGPARVRGLLLS